MTCKNFDFKFLKFLKIRLKSQKLIEGFSFKIIDAGCESDLTMTERHSDHFAQDKVQFRKGFKVHEYYKSDKSSWP